MMRYRDVPTGLLISAVFSACASDAETCEAGLLGCECLGDFCLNNVPCFNGYCDPNGGDGDGDSGDGDGDPGGPVIESFVVNVDGLDSPSDVATFTAIVTDPQGPSDVQQGELTGPAGDPSYGFFANIGGSTWELELAYNDAIADQAANDSSSRTFRAVFRDHDGHDASVELETWVCDDEYVCANGCFDLFVDPDHCGDCELACDYYEYCYAGHCYDDYDYTVELESREIATRVPVQSSLPLGFTPSRGPESASPMPVEWNVPQHR